jgi:hypothetical protein
MHFVQRHTKMVKYKFVATVYIMIPLAAASIDKVRKLMAEIGHRNMNVMHITQKVTKK